MQVFISDHQQPRPYVAPFSHNIYVTYNRQTTHRIAVSRQKYIFCGGGLFSAGRSHFWHHFIFACMAIGPTVRLLGMTGQWSQWRLTDSGLAH